ncbi:unnamed protein product [Caenorhabditis auriculariae]|uniref:Glutaredoxin domain-containing protein n=1 Tax=Caenorhabditis auriculariae TaxID=2777116 RepID=A0A8S1HQ61_9PELO|nr:unnamed protein product [Caenorhabditis auriculariae]
MGQSESKKPEDSFSVNSRVIRQEIAQHPVVLYTKDNCGYCVQAKNDLYEAGIKYTEKNLDTIAAVQEDKTVVKEYLQSLIDLTRQKTVPQIFVCGKFIGGYSELKALNPKLMSLLEQCSTDNGETLTREIAAKL